MMRYTVWLFIFLIWAGDAIAGTICPQETYVGRETSFGYIAEARTGTGVESSGTKRFAWVYCSGSCTTSSPTLSWWTGASWGTETWFTSGSMGYGFWTLAMTPNSTVSGKDIVMLSCDKDASVECDGSTVQSICITHVNPSARLVSTDNIGLNLDDTTGTLSDAEVDNITVTAGTVSDKTGYSIASGGFPVGGFATGAITADAIAAGAVKEIKDFAAKCDISAATSGTSFTIATCTDEDGSAITLATDWFVGSYMVAYTNGGAQCNVVGHGVFVSDLTAGVVTVKETDMPGSGFPATPNTTNCGVRIYP